jgi:ceramide glucosyltransferase
VLILLLTLAAFIALAYQAVSLVASLAHMEKSRLARSRPLPAFSPPVSILKPVMGLDDGLLDALRLHARQEYPEYEILIGVHAGDDPAVPVIRQVIEEHPAVPIRLIETPGDTPNGKVGLLIELAAQARHDVLIVNDADIDVPPDYLRRVAARLQDEGVGMVTCLYRARAASLAGKWEALGIATDFIPSTLVAPLVGVKEFGLGSTLCFRRGDLEAAGGFESIAEYIADDYQLAKRINALGKGSVLSEVVVETTLSEPDWAAVWRHQVRWARTIRVSRGDGYAGLPVTHAGLWALVCLAFGQWPMALTLWLARAVTGAVGGYGVLRYRPALLCAPALVLWDLWAFAVWLAGLTGNAVEWRGERMRLSRDGRLERIR